MTKKILLILGILIIAGIAAFFIFSSKPAPKEGESRVGFSIRDYLPFGNSNNNNNTDTGTSTGQTNNEEPNGEENPFSTTTEQENKPVPRLRKISSQPVSGAVIFNVGSTSVARFVEKGSGNVYEATSDSVAIKRLTNTTIPKIIRSFWLPNGSGFLAQTLVPDSEIIETNFIKLNKNSASSTNQDLTSFGTTVSNLPTGIKEIAVKPDSSKIFYYTISGSYSDWFVSNPDGTGALTVFSYPLTEWLPKWISGDTVIMQTKGSSESTGFVYSFNVKDKVLKKNGTGSAGLSSSPNMSESIGLISSGGSAPKLFLINNRTATSTGIAANTLAEKCLWTKEKSPTIYCAVPNQIPGGNYPDVWYKGIISTEDTIKKIDIRNDIFSDVADLVSMSKQKIDVIDMFLSPDETHLIFRNKIDGYLWMLRIAE